MEEVVHAWSFPPAPPVIKFVNLILYHCACDYVTDVEVELIGEECRFSIQRNGILYEARPPEAKMGPDVISRIKEMASLNTAERCRRSRA